MKRGDLPVFTATSAIPFGINPNVANSSAEPAPPQIPESAPTSVENMKPFDASVWDVPETPKK
jgi:hypothetical protein